MENMNEIVESGLLGFATADALGVPIEFTSRHSHELKPLTEMVGYGSHSVPAGTWSDDTSMTIATMDSIWEKEKIDYDDIMSKYCQWYNEAKYTATDRLFDIGIGTRNALEAYEYRRFGATDCGGKDIRNNGNGSLMRMFPVVCYLYATGESREEATKVINDYSGLTHGHSISKLGCQIYYDFMTEIMDGKSKEEAFDSLRGKDYSSDFDEDTVRYYQRILDGSLKDASIDEIRSSGFVVDTLEACLWTLLHTNSYEQAAVTAINLGDDTDTVGAITGSMAGVVYGKQAIPTRWTDKLLRKDYLETLARGFSKVISKKSFIHDNESHDYHELMDMIQQSESFQKENGIGPNNVR